MMNIGEFLDQKYNSAANGEPSTEGSMVVSSSEGHTYTVTTSSGLYHCSSLIRDLMDLCPLDDSSKEPTILEHVTTTSLLILIEWCDKHRNDPKPSKEEDDDDEKLTPGEKLHGHRFRAYPEADPFDVELFSTLKAVEFYEFIEAATYLMVENFAKSATRVWLHYMKPRIGKDFENFMFPETCSPDEPFNVGVLHDERDRLFLESHYKGESWEGVKKVTTKSGPNEQPSTSREEEPLNQQLEKLKIG